MGKTLYEKIIARASGKKEVKPGDIVWIRPDLIACQEMGWRGKVRLLEEVGLQKILNPKKLVVVADHCIEQSANPDAAENNKYVREWVKKNDVDHFYDIGRGGLMVQVLAEKGHVRPSMMVIADDTEVEGCGALGALCKGGEDISMAMAIDEFWFEVPEFVRCNVNGRFENGVTSIDLRLKLLGDFGSAFGKYVEFFGPTIDHMSIDERMSLCAHLNLSGSIGIIGADDKTAAYLSQRTKEPIEVIRSDPDSEFAVVYEYNVSEMGPQVAFPPSPNNVKPIAEAEGISIDEACVGSCASGRLDDLRIAARVLKDRRVNPRVRMYITPSSQEVHLNALKEGLISVFVEAGALVYIPSCGTCPGHMGRLAAGEVCIATNPVNSPGRMGSREASIYLANPAAVAASAVEGKIVDPRRYL